MENINQTNVSGEVSPVLADENVDYVAAIQELQENTVSKDAYNKLRSENKKLLDALVSGQQIDTPPVQKPDVKELRKKLFNKDGNLSNLEYVDTALKLRQALIDSGEQDPFLPYGDRVKITAEMHRQAEDVAKGLQECVDFADGDSGIFTAQLQRITKDVLPMRRR